jgi:hypothetical protein
MVGIVMVLKVAHRGAFMHAHARSLADRGLGQDMATCSATRAKPCGWWGAVAISPVQAANPTACRRLKTRWRDELGVVVGKKRDLCASFGPASKLAFLV